MAFATDYVLTSQFSLLHVLDAKGDLLNLTGEAGLIASDADVSGIWRLVVETNIGYFICRIDPRLSLLASTFSDRLSVDGNRDLSTFSKVLLILALVGEVEHNVCGAWWNGIQRCNRKSLKSQDVVGIYRLAVFHV